MVFCSGSNIWNNRMIFVSSVLLESTVIKFWVSTRNLTFWGLWVDKLKMFWKILFRGKKLAGHVFLIWKCKWRKGKLFLDFCDKSFSEKSKFVGVECLLLQDEHIIVFCVFTFRVDYEMYSFCRYGNYPYEKYLHLGEDEQL